MRKQLKQYGHKIGDRYKSLHRLLRNEVTKADEALEEDVAAIRKRCRTNEKNEEVVEPAVEEAAAEWGETTISEEDEELVD